MSLNVIIIVIRYCIVTYYYNNYRQSIVNVIIIVITECIVTDDYNNYRYFIANLIIIVITDIAYSLIIIVFIDSP